MTEHKVDTPDETFLSREHKPNSWRYPVLRTCTSSTAVFSPEVCRQIWVSYYFFASVMCAATLIRTDANLSLRQSPGFIPLLTIRLELVGSQVRFNPTLDESSSSRSVQESVQRWLDDFVNRGELITPVDSETKVLLWHSITMSTAPALERLCYHNDYTELFARWTDLSVTFAYP